MADKNTLMNVSAGSGDGERARPGRVMMNAMPTSAIHLILVLGLFLTACAAEEQAAGDQPAADTAAAVAQEDPFTSVLAEGEVVPLQAIDLSFQLGGVVDAVLIEEGEQVAAGDPLVTLDATDLELALQQAEARLVSAEAALAGAQARLAVAESGVNSAQQQVVAAQARLDLTRAGPRPEAIAAAEKSLEAAAAGVSQAIGQRDAALDVVTDSAVEAARANVASANARLIALEDAYDNIINACFTPPGGDEICPLYGPIEEQTRAQLEAARANAAAAQAQLDQLLSGATPGQRTAAQGGVTLALAQEDVAQANLDLILFGATPEQIKQSEVAVRQAETGVTIAEAGVVQAQAAVTQAQAALETARTGVTAAQLAVERATIRAPFAGTVGRVFVNEGQLIGPGLPVLRLADLEGWLVKTTDLTELDVAKIEPGSEVAVTFDAIPNETLSGTVTAVSLVSTLSQGDVVYEVTIRLGDTAGLPVRWGMTTFIDVDVN